MPVFKPRTCTKSVALGQNACHQHALAPPVFKTLALSLVRALSSRTNRTSAYTLAMRTPSDGSRWSSFQTAKSAFSAAVTTRVASFAVVAAERANGSMALVRNLAPEITVRGCVQSMKGSLSTVAEIVGNAVVCALTTCVANYIWSLGNFFSGKAAEHQSRVAFLAAALGTSHLISGAMTVFAQAHVLCSFHFVARTTQSPSISFCVRTLLRASWIAFTVTELLMVASVYVASLGPPGLRAYKVEFYLACFTGHALTTVVATNTRHIIRTQTVQGQQAAQRRRERQAAAALPGPASSVDNAPNNSSTIRTLSVSKRIATFVWHATAQAVQFSKTYVHLYQGELPVIISGLYVHLTIRLGIPTDAMGLVVFAIASLVLKVVAQEAAKVMLTKKKVGDIRTMCVAIGLPPILIDTQIRIVLQYAQNTTVAVTGILGLGIVEIGMRVAKLLWLKSQIRRHRRRAQIPRNSVVPADGVIGSDPLIKDSGSASKLHLPASSTPAITDSDTWERRLWQLHTAELYTDMSAEYMAISCSTCFLYFFGSHPKYMLERTLSSLASGTGASTPSSSSSSIPSGWSAHVSSSMALQLVVEVIVDLCSCVVEISAGTDFAQLRQYRYFVVSFLANLAVANLQIAGVMYHLRED